MKKKQVMAVVLSAAVLLFAQLAGGWAFPAKEDGFSDLPEEKVYCYATLEDEFGLLGLQ